MILPVDTSSMSSDDPTARAAGGISMPASSDFSVCRSASSWSANGAAPSVVLRLHRMYSMRCQPVNAGSSTPSKSSTRASTAPSISSTRPAIGSIRSHPWRDGAYAALAASRLPARTASVNTVVAAIVSSTCSVTYVVYDASASSTSGLSVDEPSTSLPMPEPGRRAGARRAAGRRAGAEAEPLAEPDAAEPDAEPEAEPDGHSSPMLRTSPPSSSLPHAAARPTEASANTATAV